MNKKISGLIELARLDKPIGVYLLLWPSLLGLLLAGFEVGSLNFKSFIIVILGSVLVRSCGCVINDISDFKIDKLVTRTVGRPLATGSITIFEAWVFFIVLGSLSVALLVFTNTLTLKISLFFALLIMVYPLTKRFFPAPQFVLGITFGSGSLIAYSLQSDIFSFSLVILYLGIVSWIIGFDTLYAMEDKEDDIKINDGLIPGLLKTCTLGYDGKGQFKINKKDDISSEIDFSKEYILEKFINLKKEISVIISRFGHQRYEIYEPIENVHQDQILKYSKIPAEISDKIKNQAIDWSTIIAEELDYIGTLCVEFFIDNKDNLYANEIAPRVHNSGHLTINSHNISQFENHVRAVCGLEKLETKKIHNARMINLIGADIEDYRGKSFKDNEFFFDYLKNEIRDKRKMGHFTIVEK
mgnify:CR=1 FL=1